jgi:multiple sugar transport system permease protein
VKEGQGSAPVAAERVRSFFRIRLSGFYGYLFILPAALFLLLFMVYPVAFNIQLSFHDLKASNLIRGSAPFVGLDNYRAAFADPIFAQAAKNTVVFTIGSLVFQMSAGLLLALFYHRDFPGSRFMRSLYFIPWAIPVVVTGAVFRWLLDGQFGVINWVLRSLNLAAGPIFWLVEPKLALGAVILTNIWLGIPLNMSLLLAGLQGIPESLYEAASVDGANALSKFRHITLPLLRPAFLAVLMLGLIYTFKVFALIWVMTRGGPVNSTQVMATLAYKLVFDQFQFGKGAAILNMLFLVLFVLSLGYLRAVQLEEKSQ